MSSDSEKKIARLIQKEAGISYQDALHRLRSSRIKIDEEKKASDEKADEIGGPKERWSAIAVRIVVDRIKNPVVDDDNLGHFSTITRKHP